MLAKDGLVILRRDVFLASILLSVRECVKSLAKLDVPKKLWLAFESDPAICKESLDSWFKVL